MKKLFIFLLVLFATATLVTAEQTVKTIELPIGFAATTVANTVYTKQLNMQMPDGYSQILGTYIRLTGDYANTATIINAHVRDNKTGILRNCTPTSITTPGVAIRNYQVLFDCTNVLQNISYKGGPIDVGFSTSKVSNNIFGTIQLTYYNQPRADIQMFGTEYLSGANGKIWVQLLDQAGNLTAINNGICYLDIYGPENTLYVSNTIMTNSGIDGVYYYDFVAPQAEGVYPALAECFYTNTEVRYFPTTYTTVRGTTVYSNLDSAIAIDGNYFQSTENAPNPRRVTVEMDFNNMTSCTNVSETFLTGLNIFTYGRLDSVTNDDVTIQIWNYTSARWIPLPNTILEGATWRSVSNSIALTNITKAGLWNASNGVRLRFNDSSLADTANNGFQIDQVYVACEQISQGKWVEVKGSSEIHISSGTYYDVTLDSGNLYNNTISDRFEFYYTIGSKTAALREDEVVALPVYSAFPCSHIYNVALYNGTAYNNISFTRGLDTANGECQISFSIDLNKSTNYAVRVDADNFWKRQILSYHDSIKLQGDAIEVACYNYIYANNLSNFTYPASVDIPYNDSFYGACERYFDYNKNFQEHYNTFAYFFNILYNFTVEEMDALEAEYVHLEDSANSMQHFGNAILVSLVLGDSYSTAILSDPYPPTNPTYMIYFSNISSTKLVPYTVWNYPIRNLTYYPPVNVSGLNVTVSVDNDAIADAVWNATDRNLTYYPPATVDTNAVASSVWNYTTRNLTYYPAQVDMTNYTLINSGVWTYLTRNLTYYAPATVNNTDIAIAVWNYTTRNLTYYPAQVDMTNYTLINSGVWTYLTRNLTYYAPATVNNTDIAIAVWNESTGRYINGIIN